MDNQRVFRLPSMNMNASVYGRSWASSPRFITGDDQEVFPGTSTVDRA